MPKICVYCHNEMVIVNKRPKLKNQNIKITKAYNCSNCGTYIYETNILDLIQSNLNSRYLQTKTKEN